jgi:hypothetical protein
MMGYRTISSMLRKSWSPDAAFDWIPRTTLKRLPHGSSIVFSPRPEMLSTTGATATGIENGRIFTLKVKEQDLEKTEAMFRAAWLVACMASFSGASEAWDQLDRKLPSRSLRYLYLKWMPKLQPRPCHFLANTDSGESDDESDGESDSENEHQVK